MLAITHTRLFSCLLNCVKGATQRYKTRNSFGFIFFTSFATIKTLKIGPSTIMHLSMFSPRGEGEAGGGGGMGSLGKSTDLVCPVAFVVTLCCTSFLSSIVGRV